ncbi:sugar transferase [Skermania piniformis]|uniref:Sugar transferase n=1 Tax=Skermania pinensis TaxID=39122 RepID=A0ABX8S572_9ACTN|nr:sugar transferase [Skermania piniformis]
MDGKADSVRTPTEGQGVLTRSAVGGGSTVRTGVDGAERALLPIAPGRGRPTLRHEWEPTLVRRVRVVDLVVVSGAALGAQAVGPGAPATLQQVLVVLVVIAAWLGALAVHGSHSPRVLGSGPEEYRCVISATLRLFGLAAIAALLLRADAVRGYFAVTLPLGLAGLLVTRWLVRRAIARMRERGESQTAVLIVGRERATRDVAASFARNLASGHRVVGVCVPGYSGERGQYLEVGGRNIPIFGDERSVIAALEFSGADTVAVTATEELGHGGIQQLIWQLESYDVDLVVSPGVVDIAGPRLLMRPVAGLPLIYLDKPAYRGAQRLGKWFFDIAVAVVALLLTIPLLLVIAGAIKVSSRGPVLYRSSRVGRNGKQFSMLKFRSMVADADELREELQPLNEADGGMFKIRDDPRVTPIGRFIRRYSLDELPQFVNVVKGEMSVVGPRPPLPSEVADYEGEVHRRLLVKPGMTGLWQIGGRSDLSWEETVRLDLSYVDNWSTIGDLLIVVKTVRAVLAGEGAY